VRTVQSAGAHGGRDRPGLLEAIGRRIRAGTVPASSIHWRAG
jgi:hypothetical protein